MATTSNMFLYSLTIQPPTTVTQAIVGQFSGTKEQQIITACGTRLSLLRPDPSQGKVITILSHDVFGIIRSIAAFRLAGSNKGKRSSIFPVSLLFLWALSDSKPTCQIFHRCQHDRHVSVLVRRAFLPARLLLTSRRRLHHTCDRLGQDRHHRVHPLAKPLLAYSSRDFWKVRNPSSDPWSIPRRRPQG